MGCENINNKESGSSHKIKVEYGYMGSYDRWDPASTEQTFSPANVKVEVGYEQSVTQSRMDVYSTWNICDLIDYLNDYVFRYVSTTNYPFYVQIAYSIYIDGVVWDVVGISNNWRYSRWLCILNEHKNFSFIYFYNITYYNSGLEPQGLVNRTAAHELIHQVGNTFDDAEHWNHDNATPCKCALWGNINECYNFSQNVRKFELCPRHASMVENGPGVIWDSPLAVQSKTHNDNLVQASSRPNKSPSVAFNGCKLNLLLSKNVFKEYEPVVAMFEYVNTKKDVDTIESDFHEFYPETEFVIEHESGKIYDKPNSLPLALDYINAPRYYVPPGDTFIASMRINFRFGEPVDLNMKYFDLYGYLPPGKYKVYAKSLFDANGYVSNIQEFQIVGLDSEDEKALELARGEEISKLLSKYPESVFLEHALVWYAANLHSFNNENIPPSREQILNDYKIFLDRFPNSYYVLNSRFIESFLGRLALLSKDFFGDIEYIKAQYPGTLLHRILGNQVLIKGFYNRFMKSQESQQKNKNNENKNK